MLTSIFFWVRAFFFVVYESGCAKLDDCANVGKDGKAVPWSTLSAAARALYGTNANGFKSFVVTDETSPWNGKTVGSVRVFDKGPSDKGPSDKGPGFANTLSEKLSFTFLLLVVLFLLTPV